MGERWLVLAGICEYEQQLNQDYFASSGEYRPKGATGGTLAPMGTFSLREDAEQMAALLIKGGHTTVHVMQAEK